MVTQFQDVDNVGQRDLHSWRFCARLWDARAKFGSNSCRVITRSGCSSSAETVEAQSITLYPFFHEPIFLLQLLSRIEDVRFEETIKLITSSPFEGFIHYQQAIGTAGKYSRMYSRSFQPSESRYLILVSVAIVVLLEDRWSCNVSSRLQFYAMLCVSWDLRSSFEVLSDHRIHNTKKDCKRRIESMTNRSYISFNSSGLVPDHLRVNDTSGQGSRLIVVWFHTS